MAEFTVGIALAWLGPMLTKYLQNLSAMSDDYYRKVYGQMCYIIGCKQVFYIPRMREFFGQRK